MMEFSAFRDASAALPSGPLALNDVRTAEFVIHEAVASSRTTHRSAA
jgi:hypothetical protein